MRESEVTQSCLTFSDPPDCSPPGSSVHGISQARVLEWGAIAFSEQDGRRGEIAFRMKPIPSRDAQRAHTKLCAHQVPETPTETEPDLPLSVSVSPAEARVSSGLPQGQGFCLPQTWDVLHMA